MALAGLGWYIETQPVAVEQEPQINFEEEAKRQRIEEIRNSEEFQKYINTELERRYLEEVMDNAIKQLEQIEGTTQHDSKKAAAVLREVIGEYNPGLAEHADFIVQLPRWVEAVAISYKETHFCTQGVGSSRNNCGAIKNSQTGQFKVYASQRDAIEDISILLNKPAYKNLTIAQMNGFYCQDSNRPGRKCHNWDVVINQKIQEIKAKLVA